VAAARGPAGYDADDDLGHEADDALHLEDVQAPGSLVGPRARRRVVLVPVSSADALVAAAAEGPAAVLRARSVAGEQHHADAGVHAGVIECAGELVDRLGPERVAHLGPVERDPGDSAGEVVVVGDVGQLVEPVDRLPH
jgi:hypothetical protein